MKIERVSYELTDSGVSLVSRNLPKVGDRIGAVCGPGMLKNDDPGTVIEIVSSKWGDSAKVAMDDGRTEYCEGLTNVGIGWYLLEKQLG